MASASSSSLNGVTRQHRPEDLLLEHPHLVVPLQDGGLHVEALLQLPAQLGLPTADQHLSPLLLADIDVGEDLLQLVVGCLRTDHRAVVERVALLYLADTGDRLLHEAIVDLFMHQRAARSGADLALVQREHGEAFERLVEEIIVLGGDVGEEDVRRLAAQLQQSRG